MMTIQAQVSVDSLSSVHFQVSAFIPREYQIFAGLDVDKHSIAVTFCNQEELLRSLRLPIVRRSRCPLLWSQRNLTELDVRMAHGKLIRDGWNVLNIRVTSGEVVTPGTSFL